jgi:hypothetical protein
LTELLKAGQVKPEGGGLGATQTPKPLTQKHRGPAPIAPFQVEMGDGDLEKPLEHGPQGA